MEIRKATKDDEASVVEIMNQAIRDSKNAYLKLLSDKTQNTWYSGLMEKAIAFVVATLDGVVVGWGTLTPYREGRGALSSNTEITFYVHDHFKRRGAGTMLIQHLENQAMINGKSQAVAILMDDNRESKQLLQKLGYSVRGEFPKIARFSHKLVGHLYMWKSLDLNHELK